MQSITTYYLKNYLVPLVLYICFQYLCKYFNKYLKRMYRKKCKLIIVKNIS